MCSSKLRKNSVGMPELHWSTRLKYQVGAPCRLLKKAFVSTRPTPARQDAPSHGKAAASEEAKRTLRYVEPLSDVRTQLADFFSSLLEEKGFVWTSGERGLPMPEGA
jgi:hypothetical protein